MQDEAAQVAATLAAALIRNRGTKTAAEAVAIFYECVQVIRTKAQSAGRG